MCLTIRCIYSLFIQQQLRQVQQRYCIIFCSSNSSLCHVWPWGHKSTLKRHRQVSPTLSSRVVWPSSATLAALNNQKSLASQYSTLSKHSTCISHWSQAIQQRQDQRLLVEARQTLSSGITIWQMRADGTVLTGAIISDGATGCVRMKCCFFLVIICLWAVISYG